MAVEEIYGLFADSDPDGGLVGAADDATDEDIQAKHKQLAEAAVNAVERGDEARLRKVCPPRTEGVHSTYIICKKPRKQQFAVDITSGTVKCVCMPSSFDHGVGLPHTIASLCRARQGSAILP